MIIRAYLLQTFATRRLQMQSLTAWYMSHTG